MKIAIVSGYFDPIHSGHIDNIKFAKKYGEVVVIVNNDKQAVLKKGKPFMDQFNRQVVVSNLKDVYKTYISIDKDPTVCKTIEKIAKDFKNDEITFCKSGDRNLANVPEVAVCNKLGIKIAVDDKTPKVYSSS